MVLGHPALFFAGIDITGHTDTFILRARRLLARLRPPCPSVQS